VLDASKRRQNAPGAINSFDTPERQRHRTKGPAVKKGKSQAKKPAAEKTKAVKVKAKPAKPAKVAHRAKAQ